MGNKSPAYKGDLNGIRWRLISYRNTTLAYHIVACQAFSLIHAHSRRDLDEFSLHLLAEALDVPDVFCKQAQLIPGRRGEQALLRGAQVPRTDPGPAQAGEAASGRATVSTSPSRFTGDLPRGCFQTGQMHENQIFIVKPHRGYLAARGPTD